MEAGHTSASRRGATIYTLADDPSSRWFVLARRVLDDLETAPHVLASVDRAGLSGPQAVVWCLYQPWSRKKFSFRAIAGATGTTTHNIEKHLRAARKAIGTAPGPAPDPDRLDLAWRRWRALERFIASPPGAESGGSFGADDRAYLGIGVRVDAKGTHWPAEKWQPPLDDEPGYGPTVILPQDADAARDVR